MGINRIDLHVHTTASDGSENPTEVVRQAASLGLKALAITDHDTLSGLEEAEKESVFHDLELVRGCEISTLGEWGEIHLLGLWLPKDSTRLGPLEAVMTLAREKRHTRNRQIVQKLADLGIPITYEHVLAIAGGDAVGRPHFAEVLTQLNVVNSRKQAYREYLGNGRKAYVDRDLIGPEEGVRALAATGACVSLAHPCLGHKPDDALDDLVARLVPLGLTAIEAYHSEHSPAAERYCVDLASKFDLLLTGGSDYHGLGKPEIKLGTGKGGLRVSAALLAPLKERIQHSEPC